MSTGSINEREIQSKEDFVKKGSMTTALGWCEECRKILGLNVLGTDSHSMANSIEGVTKGLKKLDDLAPFGVKLDETLQGFEQEYKGIAHELELLRAEYAEFEKKKKQAKFRSSEEKNYAANMKSKKQEIVEKAKELESLNTKVAQVVTDEKNRQKSVSEGIKKKPDGKQIFETRKTFGKELVKLSKTAEYFASKYDAETAKAIALEVENFSQLNWLTIDTAAAANDKLNEIKNRIIHWQKTKTAYDDGKKLYSGAIKEAQNLMQRAETVLPLNELTGSETAFMNRFARGEQAALNKQWNVAGQKVNASFNQILAKRLEQVEADFNDWQRVKTANYQKIKQLLESVTIKQYQVVGLSRIAQVVAACEKERNFKTAVEDFNKAETEAERIIAAATQYNDKYSELTILAVEVKALVDNVTGIGKPYAEVYPTKVDEEIAKVPVTLIAGPFGRNVVPTSNEIDQEFTRCTQLLEAFRVEITDLADDNKAAIVQQQHEESGDIRPLLVELGNLADQVAKLISEYGAMHIDPTGDPAKLKSWNQKATGAKTWIERRERELENDTEIDFKAQQVNQQKFKSELLQAQVEVTDAILNSEDAVNLARTNLTNELKILKGVLKIARLQTLRQATWHTSATEEVEQIEALLKTDNKGAFESKLLRVRELINQSKNVISDTALDRIYPQESITIYDTLKGGLQKLIEKFNSSDTKLVMRRQSERYAGKSGILVQTLAELRADGPGAMVPKKTEWVQRFRTIRDEALLLLNQVSELVKLREACMTKITETKNRISGELCIAIKKASKKTVPGDTLPVMGKVQEAEGLTIAAETKERFQQILKQLANINDEIDWAIEDINKGGPNGAVKQFIQDSENAQEVNRNKLDQDARFKAQYDLAKEAYQKAREQVKSSPGFDTGEFKRFVDMYKQAKTAFDKKNWSEAAKKMDLACRLMRGLAENPLASQTTERGQEHLKELNVRWTKAISTATSTLENLSGLIYQSCQATDGLTGPQQTSIKTKFDGMVVKSITKELDPTAFQRELLVLQGPVPSKGPEKEKDLANKRKYREQALAKARNYKRLIVGNPSYQVVMFQNNPWRKQGGTVNGLDLMRAINDINLNVERGVG